MSNVPPPPPSTGDENVPPVGQPPVPPAAAPVPPAAAPSEPPYTQNTPPAGGGAIPGTLPGSTPGSEGSGQSAYGQQPYGSGAAAPKPPVLSIISLVAGIIGLLGFWVVFIPFVGGIMQLLIPAGAVVLGFLGKQKEPQAKGFWLTGLITGFVGLAIGLLSLILWGIVFATVGTFDYNNPTF